MPTKSFVRERRITIMYTRHFRAPLTFKSDKFARGYKKENKFKVSTAILSIILKGLYIFLLLAIDLILFTDSGNLNIFKSDTFLSSEIIWLLSGVLSFTIIIMAVTSFSRLLQDAVCALFTGLFIIVLLNQFAQFDPHSFIGDYLQIYMGSAVPMFFYNYSNIILAVFLAIIAFVILYSFGLIVLSVYVLMFIIAFAGILRYGFNNNRKQHDFIEIYQSQLKNYDTADGQKFIYIMLPNLSSYKYFAIVSDKEAKEVENLMLGFFAKNKFEVFSNAYNEQNDAFMNMVRSVNLFSEEDPQKHIMDTMLVYKYWKFFNVNDEYIFLKDNQMFDTFRKAGYKISAYKSRGFDLCQKNHMFNVDRCTEKLNRPVNLYSMQMKTTERSQMLFIEWLSSMKLFKNMSGVYQALRVFGEPEKMPLVGINYNNLYVINSVKTFDVLADNIIEDKGRQAYFVYADIPSDMFIYDEYCDFKPRDEWINMQNMPWITKDNTTSKQRAYFEQTKCLYGKFQEFINKLDKAGLLNKSVIVIDGVSGVNNFKNQSYSDFVDDFIYNKITTIAIKSPINKDIIIDNNICQSHTVLRNYLYKDNSCDGLESINIHHSLKDELVQKLQSLEVSKEEAKQKIPEFESWYKRWCHANHINSQESIDIIKKDKSKEPIHPDTTSEVPELQNDILQQSSQENK